MEVFDYNFPIIKTRFIKHEYWKMKVLSDICSFDNSIKKSSDDPIKQQIFQTDWNTPRYVIRNYFDQIENDIFESLRNTYSFLGIENPKILNYWYQRYEKGNGHSWHNHPGVSYANVYYLEFNSKSPATEFRIIGSDRVFSIDVNEGDIITFPAIIWHRSPPNLDNAIKTIISFNI